MPVTSFPRSLAALASTPLGLRWMRAPQFLPRTLWRISFTRGRGGGKSAICTVERSFADRRWSTVKARAGASGEDSGSEGLAMGREKVQEAGYGAWRSPITAELVSGAAKKLGGKALDSQGRLLYVEGRPWEFGRYVLMREGLESGASPVEITPAGFCVRSTAHEYGGGAFSVADDVVIFSNYADQRLYKQSLSADMTPVPLSPRYDGKAVRYADGEVDKQRDRYITVREDHRLADKEAINEIVAIQLNGDPDSEPEVLLKGNDFYAYPRLSPDGQKLAWMEWSHPNMPWDRTTLWVGDILSSG